MKILVITLNIYFPIIPVYVGIMFISFIIMIVTLSSKNNHRVVKIINTVFFTFIQMLFALFIYIVESNNIDISANSNLYSNEQTMTLLELGMGMFVIWIFILLIIFYLKKADKIFKVKKIDETDDFDEYINDYNENTMVLNPIKTPIVDTSFNNSSIQSLVPEIQPMEEEVVTFDDLDAPTENISQDNNYYKVDRNVNLSNNVFGNFDFVDLDLERKNDDVEVIDLDL